MEKRMVLAREFKTSFGNKYLLDKILHNHLRVTGTILSQPTCQAIFLLRDARETLESILKMGEKTNNSFWQSPANAADYYCDRLSELERLAENLKQRYYFIDSEDLVSKTDSLLNDLSQWLSLDQPLSKNYNTFENTGRPLYGDPSHNIRSGVIMRTHSEATIKLPVDVLAQAEAAHSKCRRAILAGSVNQAQ